MQAAARRVQRLLDNRDEFVQDSCGGEGLDLRLGSAKPTFGMFQKQDLWEHPQKQKKRCAAVDGFSLHAGVSIAADDRKGLARL